MMAFNCCLLVAQMSNLCFILLKRKRKQNLYLQGLF